jgi:hypothetical protein
LAPLKFLSPAEYSANNSSAVIVMLFHCPRITLRLAVLRPTGFPKRRGVQVLPLLVFVPDGCCTASSDTAPIWPNSDEVIFQIIGERRKTELLGLIFLIFDMYKTRTKPVQMRLEGCFGRKKAREIQKKAKSARRAGEKWIRGR